MERDRDTSTGRFNEQYPDEAFLEAIDSMDIPSTNEIADFVGCSYGLAYHRLNELAEEGVITMVEVGNSLAWAR